MRTLPLQGVLIPVLVTAIIHAGAVALLFVSWQAPAPVLLKRTDAPVMKAKLVELRQKAPEKPKPAAPPARVAPKPAPPAARPKPAPAPVPKPAPKPAAAPKPAPVQPAPARPQPAAPVVNESELLAALEAEAAQQAGSDEQAISSYTELIRSAISNNWSRPPSARRTMSATLLIHLTPNGDLLSVSLVQGSGDAAFDRSVEQAVRRAAPFAEIKGMESRIFERYFRRGLRLVYTPEDLRI